MKIKDASEMTLTMKVLMVMKDPHDIAGGRLQDDAVPRVPHGHVGREAHNCKVVLSPHLTQDGHLITVIVIMIMMILY